MRKLLVIALLIAILASGLGAYCVCLYKGQCGCDNSDPYRSTNMTRIVDFEPKPQIYWSRSDEAEGSGLDTFEDSRPTFQSWENKIEVKFDGGKACANEDMLIRAYYKGKPLSNTQVSFYSQGGGRKYISQVTTNENGWAVFGARPAGRYDFVAKKDGYNDGQTVFSIDICRIVLDETKKKAQTLDEEDEVAAAVYGGEYERRYFNSKVGGGQIATRVVLKAKVTQGDRHVYEKIPKEIAQNKYEIGFERKYPQIFEATQDGITLGWEVPQNQTSYFEAEYIILKSARDDTVDNIEFSVTNDADKKKSENKGIIETILTFFGIN